MGVWSLGTEIGDVNFGGSVLCGVETGEGFGDRYGEFWDRHRRC